MFVCLFVALRPKSTAMVIGGRSVHLTTLFSWASLNKQLTSNRAHTFACNWQQPFMNDSAEGRRMTVEIISWSISTKVWDQAGIELATPGSAVSFASVTGQVTDCATRPTMWYVRPAKAQTNLGLRVVWSEPLLVVWLFYDCKATDRTSFRVSKLQRRLHRLVWVYTCQNSTLLEITCRGSFVPKLEQVN